MHVRRTTGRVLRSIDQPAHRPGQPADVLEPVTEPVIAVKTRRQARGEPYRKVELERVEGATGRVRPDHVLHAVEGDSVPHPGSAVQELADLIQGDRVLVVGPADGAPFLQHAGQGGIGAT
jgi:hypothetical protein